MKFSLLQRVTITLILYSKFRHNTERINFLCYKRINGISLSLSFFFFFLISGPQIPGRLFLFHGFSTTIPRDDGDFFPRDVRGIRWRTRPVNCRRRVATKFVGRIERCLTWKIRVPNPSLKPPRTSFFCWLEGRSSLKVMASYNSVGNGSQK